MELPLRTRLAALSGRLVSELSRRAHAGSGSNIGGRVTLALDPHALELMAAGREVALVSGTNGKTTTTRLLAAALGRRGSVTTNSQGANLISGLVATLAGQAEAHYAALEVDEGLLARATAEIKPSAVVLLNLSRDQLDRIGEVRLHAESWRRAIDGVPGTRVVANADDPLVAWAAHAGRMITWVGTGQRWREDAATCPACGNRIRWKPPGDLTTAGSPERGGAPWACVACGFSRCPPDLWLEGSDLVTADGERHPVRLRLPGWCNRANAAMAAAAAVALGVRPGDALAAMAEVGTVAGRYEVIPVAGARVRLLLAKNPAGWAETLDLIRPPPTPVVVGINARVADGRDPSWLWDVPFERLQGRLVVAAGDRAHDLAVRLRYAEVEHTLVSGYRDAIAVAAAASNGEGLVREVDLAANYTAFQDARTELRRVA
ncbi:MAG: MurT ligase domain-containing protein [Acidimicrobiia bacterium]